MLQVSDSNLPNLLLMDHLKIFCTYLGLEFVPLTLVDFGSHSQTWVMCILVYLGMCIVGFGVYMVYFDMYAGTKQNDESLSLTRQVLTEWMCSGIVHAFGMKWWNNLLKNIWFFANLCCSFLR